MKNAIDYILDVKHDQEKTDGGKFVGGNCGIDAKEIYQTMIDTKRDWDKTLGRQGYHFVISFSPKEKVSQEKAYEVINDFCKEYLGDNFDYVFAIHNDQAHMHGHIVFNSVDRIAGFKYRYMKGDWEKKIQPITDSVCKKHGLMELTYDEKRVGKSYAEHAAEKKGKQTNTKIIQGDIDFAIQKSGSWQEFLVHMEKYGYKMRHGESKYKGDYITYLAPGAEKGRRSYNLGNGYSIADIKHRILTKDFRPAYANIPRIKRVRLRSSTKGSVVSRFQVRRIRRLFQSQNYRLLNPYQVDQSKVRKDLLKINMIAEDCRYVLRNHISSASELKSRKTMLKEMERLAKGKRNTLYANANMSEEQKAVDEFFDLEHKLYEESVDDDTFEAIQDRMEELEEIIPEAMLLRSEPVQSVGEEICGLRKEIRIINRILRDDENVQSKKFRIKDINMKKRNKGGKREWQKKIKP